MSSECHVTVVHSFRTPNTYQMAVHILRYSKLVGQGVSIPLTVYRRRRRCRCRRQHRQTVGRERVQCHTTYKHKQYTDKVNNEQCSNAYTSLSRYVCGSCVCMRYLIL